MNYFNCNFLIFFHIRVFVKITWKYHTLKLSHPFTISRETKTIRIINLIKAQWGDYTGFGEINPQKYYRETPDNVKKCLTILKNLPEFSPESFDDLVECLPLLFPENRSVRTAIEVAFYDIMAKIQKEPLFKYLGLPKPVNKTTSFTIGIDSESMIKRKIDEAEEFPLLKVKLGTVQDYELLNYIKKITDKQICVDINEGWSREEAMKNFEWLYKFKVLFIEQPLPAGDEEGIRLLRENTDIPIIADEALRTSDDIESIKDIYDGINIKLIKCGGLSEAVRMIKMAKKYNLKIMIGCFIESSLLVTAAAHLSGAADFLDLDGNLLIKNDPFIGVKVNRGIIELPLNPGLGIKLSENIFN